MCDVCDVCQVCLCVPHLVGVLAGGGHTDCAGPVEVEVAQLVRQSLQLLRSQPIEVLVEKIHV